MIKLNQNLNIIQLRLKKIMCFSLKKDMACFFLLKIDSDHKLENHIFKRRSEASFAFFEDSIQHNLNFLINLITGIKEHAMKARHFIF